MAAADGAAPPPSAVVREGDTVIFDVNGDRQAIITVGLSKDVKLGRGYCSAAPLIGAPYGAMFGLSADGNSLERTQYVPMTDWDLPSPETAADFNTRSNAELVDGGLDHQALSLADIQAMKAEGRAGADIVAALAANSATFAAKTEFSQAKYKKKKAKKYIQVGTVRRPTAAAVCEAYFSSAPGKTSYLRADALALMLSMANVGAHARVLVVETCGGLITAAVAERLGGYGGVCSAWAGGMSARKPSLDIWRHLNLTQEQRAALRFAPLHALLVEQRQQEAEAAALAAAAQQEASAVGVVPADQQAEQQAAAAADVQQQEAQQAGPTEQPPQQEQQPPPPQQQQPDAGAAAGAGEQAAEPMEVQSSAADAAPSEQQHQKQQEQQQPASGGSGAPAAAAPAAPAAPQPPPAAPAAAASLLQPPFNSCILAASALSPLALLRQVLPLLAPSTPFAVFCPWQHPLAEALEALRGQGAVAGLALHEPWWREMQVLPLRTHPTMNMNHGGGFILSGTVLAPQQQQ